MIERRFAHVGVVILFVLVPLALVLVVTLIWYTAASRAPNARAYVEHTSVTPLADCAPNTNAYKVYVNGGAAQANSVKVTATGTVSHDIVKDVLVKAVSTTNNSPLVTGAAVWRLEATAHGGGNSRVTTNWFTVTRWSVAQSEWANEALLAGVNIGDRQPIYVCVIPDKSGA